MNERYGPFSTYAPETVGVGYSGNGCPCDPTRGQSCRRCDEPMSGEPGWFAPVSLPADTNRDDEEGSAA